MGYGVECLSFSWIVRASVETTRTRKVFEGRRRVTLDLPFSHKLVVRGGHSSWRAASRLEHKLRKHHPTLSGCFAGMFRFGASSHSPASTHALMTIAPPHVLRAKSPG